MKAVPKGTTKRAAARHVLLTDKPQATDRTESDEEEDNIIEEAETAKRERGKKIVPTDRLFVVSAVASVSGVPTVSVYKNGRSSATLKRKKKN